MPHFAIASLAAVGLIAFVHVRETRGKTLRPVAQWGIATVVAIASLATMVHSALGTRKLLNRTYGTE